LGIPLTADEFASGKVTYILNESGNDSYLWGQNIDNGKTPDLYPCSWYDGHDTVYYNVLEDKYSNTLNAYETAFRYNGDVTMDESIDMLDVVQVLKKTESSDYLMPIEAFFAEKNEQVDTVYGDMDGDNAVTDKDAEIMLHIIMLSK
ncbi:MAG: hypothetical protein IJR59_06680, partial [Firmicutes bacterium]|nr:hypothetical protein [Bacillota bacterium]